MMEEAKLCNCNRYGLVDPLLVLVGLLAGKIGKIRESRIGGGLFVAGWVEGSEAH